MTLSTKILIVDDSASMRSVMRSNLKELGFVYVSEAKDGAIALKKLKTEKVDLILADWNMPKMNGLELLKSVRSNERLKSIPFIMITAEGKKTNIMEAIKAGVNNYIIKPFPLETLKEKITKVLP